MDRAVSGIDTHHSAVIEMERRVQNYSQRLQHVTDLGDELKMNAILIKESSAIGECGGRQ